MMLLIAMAITVAFIASWATTLGLFNLDFWWELALLIVIMLLALARNAGPLGAASGALEALAALLPDTADKITSEGVVEVPVAELAADDVVLVRSGARVPADGVVVSAPPPWTNP
jgi:Cu2+-exporting ATPase